MNTNRLRDNQIVQVSPVKTRRIVHTDNLMMAIWDFSDGPWETPEPYHSHPQDQIVYLADGEVEFFIEEESCLLSAGDTVAVPGGLPHTVRLLTEKVRLVDTWTPLRQEFLES
ncbi:cupin domain-containing protein [Pelobacter seleniigenes]|uniref:cupin domain-containing protein n=1 Tax=Pelobacter seleniigenes TaxID=407188 RepID=UPI00068F7B11|nr:cupin domain-containing protein [Pelobacter seleniigenes]